MAVRVSLFGCFKCFSRDDRALYLINTLISKDCLVGEISDFFFFSVISLNLTREVCFTIRVVNGLRGGYTRMIQNILVPTNYFNTFVF